MPMIDEWNGLAVLLADMIEKYAGELDLDAFPDPVFPEDKILGALLLWRFFTYYLTLLLGMGCVIGDSTASMRRHKKEEETPSADTLEKGEMPIAQENPEIRGYPDASEAGGNQEAERENS